jgi:hypothetical protein
MYHDLFMLLDMSLVGVGVMILLVMCLWGK